MSVSYVQGSNQLGYLKEGFFEKKLPIHVSSWRVGEKEYTVYIINSLKGKKRTSAQAAIEHSAASPKNLRKTASAAAMVKANEDTHISRIRFSENAEMEGKKYELKNDKGKSFDAPLFIDRLDQPLFEKAPSFIDLSPEQWADANSNSITKVQLFILQKLEELSSTPAAGSTLTKDEGADSDDSVKTSITKIARRAEKTQLSKDAGAAGASSASDGASGAFSPAKSSELDGARDGGGGGDKKPLSPIIEGAAASITDTQQGAEIKEVKTPAKRPFVCSRVTMVAIIALAAAALAGLIQVNYRFNQQNTD